MKRLRLTGLVLAWVVAFRGSLEIANSHGDWGHGICGPWGCGPPLQALVGCHAAWLVLLLPLTLIASKSITPKRRTVLGRLVVLFAVSGLIGVATYQNLCPHGTWVAWQQDYFWQRIGFAIITVVDLPLLELLLSGLIMTFQLPRFPSRNVVDQDLSNRSRVRPVVGVFEQENRFKYRHPSSSPFTPALFSRIASGAHFLRKIGCRLFKGCTYRSISNRK